MAKLLIVALLLTLSRPLAAEGVLAPVMRHERKTTVELGPSGEFEQVNDVETRSADDSCRNSYLLGTTGTNQCADSTLETLIDTVRACELAADEAGAARGDVSDTAGAAHGKPCNGECNDYDAQQEYPKGCYKVADANDPTNPGTFFFNPSLHDPTDPGKHGATPVCKRNLNEKGTPNSNDGCPASYSRIVDEAQCRTVAVCQGWKIDCGNLFTVGIHIAAEATHADKPPWASDYNQNPKGCFMRPDDSQPAALAGCVFFNDFSGQTADPTDPVGIPLCNIGAWAR